MGRNTDAVKGRLGTVRQATDEARAAHLSAEDTLAELEDREARRAERRDRQRQEVRR